MASNVLYRNSWCPQCAVTGPLGIKPLQDHAAALGGQCLAVEYKNVKFTVMWRCSNGHEWQATPKNVLHSGSWCPKCAKNAPIGLQRVQDHAISLGGQCLTTTYRNSHQKLTWTCRFGHSWSASAGSVLYNGSWCPTCAATIWKTEAEVRRIFETIFFPAAFDSCFPDFLAGLQLDGYCAAMRLAFEYHGEQHYDADSYFHSRDPTSFKRQQERDAAKVERCQRAGVRLMVVPYFVRDKWTFVKLALLQWFTIARVPPEWLAFQGNFEPPTKPKAQVSPRMKNSKAERKVELQTMDHIRVLHYEDSRTRGRLVVQRWRKGHADLTVPIVETKGPADGCPGGQWQE
ncbi:unnamed protein product, partial [Symbiodinium pilosum]